MFRDASVSLFTVIAVEAEGQSMLIGHANEGLHFGICRRSEAKEQD